MAQSEAYSKGYAAGILGKGEKFCPYEQGTEECGEWLDGYYAAEEDEQE